MVQDEDTTLAKPVPLAVSPRAQLASNKTPVPFPASHRSLCTTHCVGPLNILPCPGSTTTAGCSRMGTCDRPHEKHMSSPSPRTCLAPNLFHARHSDMSHPTLRHLRDGWCTCPLRNFTAAESCCHVTEINRLYRLFRDMEQHPLSQINYHSLAANLHSTQDDPSNFTEITTSMFLATSQDTFSRIAYSTRLFCRITFCSQHGCRRTMMSR